jgi:hypothetical protein
LCTLAGSVLGQYSIRTGRQPAEETEPVGDASAADALLGQV